MGNFKLPCAWVGVLMTPPNYGKIRQAKGRRRGAAVDGGGGNVRDAEEELSNRKQRSMRTVQAGGSGGCRNTDRR